jgi:putative tricarboxylic transport membrane protein
MFAGVTVGLVIGAIPGLSPPMAIALLLPVSFGMPADSAIILMISTYAAGIYGGSLSAILLRVPGTSASVATSLEGYELTRRGRAVQAIRMSTFASVVGGVLSGVALIVLAPPLARMTLLFGPAEMFLIALLGLASIAAVTFQSRLRGLLAGLVGLWLSTIGIDHYSGYPRFTFGLVPLEGGIGILPVIVGLFAFAQGLELSGGAAAASVGGGRKLSWRLWPRWTEVFHVRRSLLRGWSVGLLIGLVPAAGASVAQWISYAWEVRCAGPGDRFGKGEIKGLAATEGANNGCTGTSLIPMFIIGIPGGMSAVVILGALMMHGLQPGMRLFSANADVVYTIMWGFLFANLMMGVVASVFARLLANVVSIPRGLLGPAILVFCVIGIYAGTGSAHDVWLMIAFGVVGYFGHRWHLSPPALLLGFILGPIAESGFRDMMVVSNSDPIPYILGRPVAVVIAMMLLAALYLAVRDRRPEDRCE